MKEPPEILLQRYGVDSYEALAVSVIAAALDALGEDWLGTDCGRFWTYVSGIDRQVMWERAGGVGPVPRIGMCVEAFDFVTSEELDAKRAGLIAR